MSVADEAKQTKRWHPLAARLAGIPDSDAAQSSQINVPGNSTAAELAATIQDVTCKLGRISDLVHELTDLRLVVPALASVQAVGNAVQLVFLGVEAELKFSVQLTIGEHALVTSSPDADVADLTAGGTLGPVPFTDLTQLLHCLLLQGIRTYLCRCSLNSVSVPCRCELPCW